MFIRHIAAMLSVILLLTVAPYVLPDNIKMHPKLTWQGKQVYYDTKTQRPLIIYPHQKLSNSYSSHTQAAQKYLNANHGFNLAADGYYGAKTAAAVHRVKVRFGLSSTNGNIIDYTTWYIILTQASYSGQRYRLSGPDASYYTSNRNTYKLIYSPPPSAYFPVKGAHTYTNDWHAIRRSSTAPYIRYHKGIDIFARRGVPVVAIRSGVIKKVGYTTVGGNRVWLQTANGACYYYAHLDRIDVKYGQRVKAGQQLGTVGNTGNASGTAPHLHLGKTLTWGGDWVNPYFELKSLE